MPDRAVEIPKRTSRLQLFLLLLIIVLAAVLRFASIDTLGYWTDEFCSLSIADGHGLQVVDIPRDRVMGPLPACTRLAQSASFLDIPARLATDDNHPPLYFMLLRMWMACFGDTETATRGLCVVFSLVSLPLLFAVARESIGGFGALWACLLMAVAGPQISFALEARNYMPAMAFSLLAVLCRQRLRQRPNWINAAVFSGSLLAMMLTHYYLAALAFALLIDALINDRGRQLKLFLVSGVLAGFLFAAVWGRSFFLQMPHFSSTLIWLNDSGPGHLQRWFERVCRLPASLLATVGSPAAPMAGMAFVFLPVLFWKRPPLRFWIIWLVLAIGILALPDLIRSTAQLTLPRYLLFACPAWYVILCGALRGRYGWIIPLTAVLFALFNLPAAFVPPWKIDFRTPAETVHRRIKPGDLLIVSGPDPVVAEITFAAYQHYFPVDSNRRIWLTKPADAQTLQQLRASRECYVIWQWTDRPLASFLPGLTVEESGELPHFGRIIRAAWAAPGPEAPVPAPAPR